MEEKLLTTAQEDVIEDVLVTVIGILSANLKTDPLKIQFEDKTEVLFKGDVYEFALALLDIHIEYAIPVDYEPEKLFDLLKNIHDVCEYFSASVLIKNDLLK